MKILVIARDFVPTPVAEADHAYHTCADLARRGYDVTVLTSRTDEPPDFDGFDVLPVMGTWSWRELPALAGALRTVRPDAVLLFYLPDRRVLGSLIPFTGSVVKRVRPQATFSVFFSNVGTGEGLGPVGRRIVRLAGRYKYGTLLTASSTVFYESAVHGQRLRALYPRVADKLVQRPVPALIVWPDLSRPAARGEGRRKAGFGDDDLVIAFFGRIYPEKSIETLIESFAAIAAHHDTARLLLIGGVLDREDCRRYARGLVAMIDRLGVGAKVHWTGEYRWDSPIGSIYLQAADICVLPLASGLSFANSSLAFVSAHGLPIVGTVVGEPESPLRNRENILFCPPGDSRMLTTCLSEVIGDSDLRDRLSQGARALYEDHYSASRATDKVIAALGPKQSPPSQYSRS